MQTMKLLGKSREGGHIRLHSRPATPYQRLLTSAKLAQEAKTQPRKEFESLDPFELAEGVKAKPRAIFRASRRQTTRAVKPLRAASPSVAFFV